jgi:putative Mg2+ transporter-C (MgtC) family protein
MEWSSWLGMEAPISLVEVVLRMTLASVLGALIGWDREAQNKAAGVRTHMLVSLGAAVFILATIEMVQLTSAEGHAGADPTRVVEGIVTGIGFLGAGQIIQSRASVSGVTTAAGIWVVGSVGVACGGGYYPLAVLTTVFVLVILRVVGAITARLA